jgi:hypothetical protein
MSDPGLDLLSSHDTTMVVAGGATYMVNGWLDLQSLVGFLCEACLNSSLVAVVLFNSYFNVQRALYDSTPWSFLVFRIRRY